MPTPKECTSPSYDSELLLEHHLPESLFHNRDPINSQGIDRVALEIQRAMDIVRRNYPMVQLDKVMLCSTIQEPELCNALRTRLLEPVEPVSLADLFHWEAGYQNDSATSNACYLIALGAAIGRVGSAA